MTKQEKYDCIAESLSKLVGRITTADGLAKKLAKLGIKGKRCKPTYCPIANYLSSGCGFPVSVDSGWARPKGAKRNSMEDPYLPYAAEVFVSNFDQGIYPHLESDA